MPQAWLIAAGAPSTAVGRRQTLAAARIAERIPGRRLVSRLLPLRMGRLPRNGFLRATRHGLGAPGLSMQVLARAKQDLARICLIAHQQCLLLIFWR